MNTTNHPSPNQTAKPSPLAMVATVGRGMAMGLADAVPGVSGGTVALILGFYQRLVDHVGMACAPLRQPQRASAWLTAISSLWFLLPLGLGAVTALYLATKLLVSAGLPDEATAEQLPAVLANHPGWLLNPHTAPWVYGIFFGAVLGSIAVPWRRRSNHRSVDWLAFAGGTVIAAGVALLPPGAGSNHPAALVGAGFVALSVMLLPGISGSLALLVLGMYQVVAAAVHEREVVVLAWFIAGMVLAAALMVPVLRWSLRVYHDRIMAWLSGLLMGSLVALWPWKAHYASKAIDQLGPTSAVMPHGDWWWAVALAAIIVASGIMWLERRQHPA